MITANFPAPAIVARRFGLWMMMAAMAGVLVACGGDSSLASPPQQWNGLDVRVESRPSPPRNGMNEFIVMVTGKHGRPIYNLIISLRTDDHDEWKQAIQDGQLGIYRRAVEVGPGSRSVLQVQIKHSQAESVLLFPLNTSGASE